MARLTGTWGYGKFLDVSQQLTSELGLGAGNLAASALKEEFQQYMKQLISLYEKVKDMKTANDLDVDDLKNMYGALMSIRELILQGQQINYRIVMPNGDGNSTVSVVELNTKEFLDYKNITKSGNSLRMLDLSSANYIAKNNQTRATEIRQNYNNLRKSALKNKTLSNQMNRLLGQVESYGILDLGDALSKDKNGNITKRSSLRRINEANMRQLLLGSSNAQGPLSGQYYTKAGNLRRFNRGWVFQAAMQALEDNSGVMGFARALKYDTTPGFKAGDVGNWQIKGSNASIMDFSTMRNALGDFLNQIKQLQGQVTKLEEDTITSVKQQTTKLFTTPQFEGQVDQAISSVVNQVVEQSLLDDLDFSQV